MIRHTVIFTGRVQGVGFRYTACNVARRFRVAGYVQNLHDGSVCCVAEGDPREVEAFIESVEDAMGRNIRSKDVTRAPATGEFGDPTMTGSFGVRY